VHAEVCAIVDEQLDDRKAFVLGKSHHLVSLVLLETIALLPREEILLFLVGDHHVVVAAQVAKQDFQQLIDVGSLGVVAMQQSGQHHTHTHKKKR